MGTEAQLYTAVNKAALSICPMVKIRAVSFEFLQLSQLGRIGLLYILAIVERPRLVSTDACPSFSPLSSDLAGSRLTRTATCKDDVYGRPPRKRSACSAETPCQAQIHDGRGRSRCIALRPLGKGTKYISLLYIHLTYPETEAMRCRSGPGLGSDWFKKWQTVGRWDPRQCNIFGEQRAELSHSFFFLSSSFQFKTM